jgi:hypothetical protein
VTDDNELIRRVEIVVNEKLADLEMLRTVMKKFFLRLAMAGNPAGAEERLEDLKKDTMATLTAQPAGPADQGDERMRLLIAARGEEFFRELEVILAEARNIAGSVRGKN